MATSFLNAITKKALLDNAPAATGGGGGGDPQQNSGVSKEANFAKAIKQQIQQYIGVEYPWISPQSEINIISIDPDASSVVASIDYSPKPDIEIRIPIVYTNGEIVKPWAIELVNEKQMVAFSKDWYLKILNMYSSPTGTIENSSINGTAMNAYSAQNSSHEANRMLPYHDLPAAKYAALQQLSLMDIMPLVKTALLRGDILDVFGLPVIKTAAKTFIKTVKKTSKLNSKFTKNTGRIKLNPNKSYIITRENISKVGGLSNGERQDLYDRLNYSQWTLLQRLPRKKTAGLSDIVDLNTENFSVEVSSTYQNYENTFKGGYSKYAGSPIFYVPDTSFGDSQCVRGVGDSPQLLRRTSLDKPIENKNAFDDYVTYIRTVAIPISTAIKKYLDMDDIHKFKIATLNLGRNNYINRMAPILESFTSPPEFIPNKTSKYKAERVKTIIQELVFTLGIQRIEDGKYLISKDGVYYCFIEHDTQEDTIFTEYSRFKANAVSIQDLLTGKISISRRFNNSINLDIELKGKTVKIPEISEKTASFLLANFFKFPDAESLVKQTTSTIPRKFAMQIDDSVLKSIADSISAAANTLESVVKSSNNGPEKIVDNVELQDTVDVPTVETPVEAQAPENSAPPSVDQGGSEGSPTPQNGGTVPSAGEMPPIELIQSELQKLGIPMDFIQQAMQVAEQLGEDPQAFLMDMGSFAEQNLSQGIPIEQVLTSIQESINNMLAQSSEVPPAVAQVATEAPQEMPQQGVAQPTPQEASPEAAAPVVEAGEQMVQSVGGVDPAATPITSTLTSPDVQSVSQEVGTPINEMDIDSGIVADIVNNATIKTSLTEYLPKLNNTMNTLSQLLLKIELTKSSLSSKIGNDKLKSVEDRLRNSLDIVGSLVLDLSKVK